MHTRTVSKSLVFIAAPVLFLGLSASLEAQDPAPFLSYDFTSEDISDFFSPTVVNVCPDPIDLGTLIADGELILTNSEISGVGFFTLRPGVVQASFPASRNYRVRLKFSLDTVQGLGLGVRSRLGMDEGAGIADAELERSYFFIVHAEGAEPLLLPDLPLEDLYVDGVLGVAEFSACHSIAGHNDWPNASVTGYARVDPGFPIIQGDFYWIEVSVQGYDQGGGVLLTASLWEDGTAPPATPQIVVVDDDGLPHTEATVVPAAETQVILSSLLIPDVDLGGQLLLDDLSLAELPVTCPVGLSCLADQETGDVTIGWQPGVNFQGTVALRRGGETIAMPDLAEDTFVDVSPGAGTHAYELVVTAADGVGQDLCTRTYACEAVIVGDIFFFENFDSYANDDALQATDWQIIDVNEPVENAAWTVTNPGARANPPGVDGRASRRRFVISDSDFASNSNPTGSGMSHDLVTPSFSCAGGTTVWLHADVHADLNNNGKAVFDVDVSTDGGTTWANVFRRIAPARTDVEPFVSFDNADNFFGRLDVDLSAEAANETDVRVRFRHFEPNDDWWIAIDNVLVNRVSVTGGDVVVLENEGFDTLIPLTWFIDSTTELAPWDTEDQCLISLPNSGGGFPDPFDGRGLHHLDGSFAIVDSVCSGVPQDEYLISPVLDCRRYSKVYLHFKSALVITPFGIPEVLLSLDGGVTFESRPIFSYKGGGGKPSEVQAFYAKRILEVPDAAGQSQVAFAFHFNSFVGISGGYWTIDDVSVTAVESPEPLFIRGDSNSDGGVDISDGSYTLNFLFLGGAAAACPDAGDANDDGNYDISDASYTLNYLFLGGPPPPFPGKTDCGPDPTDDILDPCTDPLGLCS